MVMTNETTAILHNSNSLFHETALGSAASGDLFIPATNTVTIGPQAFAVECPAAWKSLPTELHDKSLSLMTVRKKLKNLFIQNQFSQFRFPSLHFTPNISFIGKSVQIYSPQIIKEHILYYTSVPN